MSSVGRRAAVDCNSVRSPSSGRNGFGRSGRLRGCNRVPPPPAMITAYMRPHRSAAVGTVAARSEAGRGHAEQHGGGPVAMVDVPMGQSRWEGDGVALAQDVVLVADPQVEHAGQDDHDLLVRVVGIRLGTGPAAGL